MLRWILRALPVVTLAVLLIGTACAPARGQDSPAPSSTPEIVAEQRIIAAALQGLDTTWEHGFRVDPRPIRDLREQSFPNANSDAVVDSSYLSAITASVEGLNMDTVHALPVMRGCDAFMALPKDTSNCPAEFEGHLVFTSPRPGKTPQEWLVDVFHFGYNPKVGRGTGRYEAKVRYQNGQPHLVSARPSTVFD